MMAKTTPPSESEVNTSGLDFIRETIARDVAARKHEGRVQTRFPPEPNGYLHIGHAKSICLNFGVASEYPQGKCNLRFDDTNPTKEEMEYVHSIQEDVAWLGWDWGGKAYFASDYFEQLYEYAVQLIQQGDAFVCELSPEQIREYRGTLTEPGRESPWRDRPPEESLDLFQRMRAGEFKDGSQTLRAKIDMSSPNVNLRDPVIYRIMRAHHHRTGDEWCIYPMYDFTHGLCDSIERVTHSLCTLEFENHRPLYDWFLERLGVFHPQQIEFARLNLTYTVVSKRKLLRLVREKVVDGWDDPRMPTICGLRRRGYTPKAIRDFCAAIGVTKYNSWTDIALLEHALRNDLNRRAPRVMAVLRPLKVVIENYPENHEEELEAINNPEDPQMGTRMVPFSREIWVEKTDFMEDPPRKFFRLAPGREVRLRYAYLITCREVIKNDRGEPVELRCTYDPESRGGNAPDGRKVKGTIHWVSARHGVSGTARLYDRLFNRPDPDQTEEDGDFLDNLNPQSLETLQDCRFEPSLNDADPETTYQFERIGYFCADNKDSSRGAPVFNRAVALRDSWAKIAKKTQ